MTWVPIGIMLWINCLPIWLTWVFMIYNWACLCTNPCTFLLCLWPKNIKTYNLLIIVLMCIYLTRLMHSLYVHNLGNPKYTLSEVIKYKNTHKTQINMCIRIYLPSSKTIVQKIKIKSWTQWIQIRTKQPLWHEGSYCPTNLPNFVGNYFIKNSPPSPFWVLIHHCCCLPCGNYHPMTICKEKI